MDSLPRFDTLPDALRVRTYHLILDIYRKLERLPEEVALLADIKRAANQLIGDTGAYPISDDRGAQMQKIIYGQRVLLALLGVARDTSLLERESARRLTFECREVGFAFEAILDELKEDLSQQSKGHTVFHNVLYEKEKDIKDIDNVLNDENKLNKKLNKGHNFVSNANETTTAPDLAESFWVREIATKTSPEIRPVETRPSVSPGVGEMTPKDSPSVDSMSLRQKAILEVLRRRDTVTVGDLGLLFTGRVSKKTLQRDLVDLVSKGVVDRKGEKRWATYVLAQKQVI